MSIVGFLVLVGWIILILFGAAIISSRVKFRSKSRDETKPDE
jgi:hypothetical protein